MVTLQAAVERAHDGHGAYGEDHGAVDKAVRKLAAAAGFPLEPIAQADHGAVQIQQLAQNGAQHHGQDGNQRLLGVADPRHGYSDDHQRQCAHEGLLHPVGQQLANKQAGKAARGDGGAVDDGT